MKLFVAAMVMAGVAQVVAGAGECPPWLRPMVWHPGGESDGSVVDFRDGPSNQRLALAVSGKVTSGEGSVSELISELRPCSAQVRFLVVIDLAERDPDRFGPVLVDLLVKDNTLDLVTRATGVRRATVLKSLRTLDAVLLQLQRGCAPAEKTVLVEIASSRTDDSRVVVALRQCMSDEDDRVRIAAICGVAGIGVRSFHSVSRELRQGLLDRLGECMDDPCSSIRAAAAFAIGCWGDFSKERVRSLLLRALEDRDEDVRKEATAGLDLLAESLGDAE